MKAMPLDIGILHFVGIGGIGMSGIAEILCELGYQVRGSDLKDSENVKRLREDGVEIFIGHKAEQVEGAACVVISSAVKQDNPEVVAAREKKIPVVRRAEMLAELMRLKYAIAIGGTHGKTTTTAMVGHMMDVAGLDPTVINGGIVNSYGTNARLGQSNLMVVEADESDGTFTRLPASAIAVTNMDPEHLDHYGSEEAMKDAYRQFITNIPFYGYAVLCTDHPDVRAIVPTLKDRKIITYGFNPQADIRAENVKSTSLGHTYDVVFANGTDPLRDVFLPMMGRHNVQNSLVAIAMARQAGVPAATIKKALESFGGVKRRFTKTGEVNGITIIDDYAHHPVEIETVLKAARAAVAETGGRIIAVKQPHRYTRLNDLFEEFSACFTDADSVIIADVYEAGESPIENRNKDALVEAIKALGHKDVQGLSSVKDLPRMIAEKARENDIVLCMGAGDITAWAYALPDQLKAEFRSDVA